MVHNEIASAERALFLVPVQWRWSLWLNSRADPLKDPLGSRRGNSCREVIRGPVLQGGDHFDLSRNIVRCQVDVKVS